MKEYDEVVLSRDFLSKTDCSALSVEMSLAEGGLPVRAMTINILRL